jgi:L-cysteine S-thiosulfotransferase
MKTYVLIVLLLGAMWLTGCGKQSPRGFRLPEGDPERGKLAFAELQCQTCHPVEGVELPPPFSRSPIQVVLGGEVTRVKTYGELVTAIIHPDYEMSEKFPGTLEKGDVSPMPEFNEFMTVGQMIDIVAFLQPRYKLVSPEVPVY